MINIKEEEIEVIQEDFEKLRQTEFRGRKLKIKGKDRDYSRSSTSLRGVEV